MNKIISFGDSFTFGSELEDNDDGAKAWPGLIAKQLNVPYATLADPGCGNEAIARQIYTYFSENPYHDTVAIINWTWMMRWDFYITAPIKQELQRELAKDVVAEKDYNMIAGNEWPSYHEFCSGISAKSIEIEKEILKFLSGYTVVDNGKWISLGPTCEPSKLNFLKNDEALHLINIYHSYFKENLLWHKYQSLQTIFAAQSYLQHNNIKAIQTYMDYEMLSNEYQQLSPLYVIELQNLIKNDLKLFDHDKNFVDWANSMGFKITPQPGNHPLEEAHRYAANLYLKQVEDLFKCN